jgi:hypothetical protein
MLLRNVLVPNPVTTTSSPAIRLLLAVKVTSAPLTLYAVMGTAVVFAVVP